MKNRFFSTDITSQLAILVFLMFMGSSAYLASSTVSARFRIYEGHYTFFIYAPIIILCIGIVTEIILATTEWQSRAGKWLRSRKGFLYTAVALLSLAPSFYITKKYEMTLPGVMLYAGIPAVMFHYVMGGLVQRFPRIAK